MGNVTRRQIMRSATAMVSAMYFCPFPCLASAASKDSYPTTWDLTPLYADVTAWNAARLALLNSLSTLTDQRHDFGSNGSLLAKAYQDASNVSRAIQRLITYAQTNADADLLDADKQARKQQAFALQDAFTEAVAWMDPATLLIGQKKINGFLASTPALKHFRFHFSDLFRQASHTLSADSEAILAAAELPLSGPMTINRFLTREELPGSPVTLTSGKPYQPADQPFSSLSREDRKLVYDSYYTRYDLLKQTLVANLLTAMQADTFKAKARRFSSSLDAALSGANVPLGVYRTLTEETERILPQLHRYYSLRQNRSDPAILQLYELGNLHISSDRTFSIQEHFETTLEALSLLGDDYIEQLKRAFSGRWLDGLPRPGKLEGSVTAAGAYDVHPYLLLNLHNGYDSLTLFAHEWGHAMHNTLAQQSQPYETYFAPIFLQEIGSTCNEQLLISYLIRTSRSRSEKKFYLYQQLRVIATVFFQNALAAEFEAKTHTLVDSGQVLSGEDFSRLNLNLMRKYYGPSVQIDPLYGVRWAQNDQFFSPFYQFQYCTSLCAAVHFSQLLITGGRAERDSYLSVLKAGGSDYGYDVLKSAGLDLATPEPYHRMSKLFSDTMDEFEQLHA
jgi:oligoendopeptidase F